MLGDRCIGADALVRALLLLPPSELPSPPPSLLDRGELNERLCDEYGGELVRADSGIGAAAKLADALACWSYLQAYEQHHQQRDYQHK